ncbi:uncharacterized protein BJ171DRAFT_165805 [Polychytrium aggregatum]|uniref:uncharacterized protein n=1 Tax=Polychytrium aggregatum TaxID=110093 RepID=UPI0022FEA524|nr:uncharacterized protein BJ171DRAFT_165805 [Polychytrium aggregatum]KAI9202689.1 hypothetical protein BJ171DRAFT_165805 [Polychytrium aggregatum]
MMSCRSPSTTADNQTLASLVETMEQTLYHESLAPGAKLTVLQDYIRKMKATLQIADPYDEDTQLPDDILLRIMLYLDGQTLCKMMQTNRRTHRLILQYEQLLWRTLTESRWLTLVNDNHILSINPHSAISKSEPRAHTELSHIVAETQSLSLSDKKQSRAGRAGRASGHSFVPEKRPWAGYFIDNTLRWKDIYEQFWNVYCGNYRFMIVMDYKESYRRHLMNDSQQQRDVHRQDHDGALWQHQRQTSPQRQMNRKGGNLRADVGCRARGVKRDRRRYVLQCGQPTQATSGYAVNLRLCGKYLCWISDTNLAVCEVNGHTPEYLSGHMAALICLSTNQRNIAVTGAEDHDVRVWDLSKRMCIGYFPGVDCLDVAVHEEVFVTYSNDNIICIWDIGTKTCLKQIDLKLHEDQIDRSILAKEVKIDFWGTNIVCGFENTTFLVVSTKPGEHIRVLMEPSSHFREELDSSAYPTVLSLYNSILVTRGIRWNEDGGLRFAYGTFAKAVCSTDSAKAAPTCIPLERTSSRPRSSRTSRWTRVAAISCAQSSRPRRSRWDRSICWCGTFDPTAPIQKRRPSSSGARHALLQSPASHDRAGSRNAVSRASRATSRLTTRTFGSATSSEGRERCSKFRDQGAEWLGIGRQSVARHVARHVAAARP